MRWSRWWRWYLIAASLVVLAVTAGGPDLLGGFFPACLVLPLWALRVHVIQEPRWTIDDELMEINLWL